MAGHQSNSPGLKTHCPRCGEIHRGQTIAGLQRAVSACRGRKPTAGVPVAASAPAILTDVIGTSIRLDRKAVSYNDTYHLHWRKVYAIKREWAELMTSAVGRTNLPGSDLWWSSWVITRFYSGREKELDYANFVASVSLKAAIDVLVNVKAIRDDKPKHFHAVYDQVRSDTSYIEFKLTDARNQTE